ncbi:MAG: ribokinase [Burkholderiaceae bacterium]
MILVAGSANLDFVVHAERIPAPGETVLGHSLATHPGGKGANQAVAVARAGGADTQMVLALGSDAYAQPLEASLRGAGVQTHIVRSTAQATGTAFICVSRDAENAITVAPGANMLLAPEHLPPLDGVTHLLMQLETPLATITAYARAARAAGVTVVLNAAPAQALGTELLELVDILIVNQGELASITGAQGSISDGLAQLQVPLVVVTLGARGCCARQGNAFVLQPAFAIDALDTTGAGDTFCGVLVAALDRAIGLADALRLASAASALACTRAGAQSAIPDQGEVAGFLSRQPANDVRAVAALRAYCGQAN